MAFPPQSPQRSLHPPDLHLHLCKLRKALTCFICHQLLQKPACLHCNHHFCMSCLLHSMEEMSACPKCKQPAATRQARFAPEMDTLVEIYQNLENATGPVIANSDDSQLEKLAEKKSMAFSVKVEDECISPSSMKRQRRHESREKLSNIAMDLTEADSRKRDASSVEVPCSRGILPASKRIQLACPPLPIDRNDVASMNLDKTNMASNSHSTLDFANTNVGATVSLGKQEAVFAHATIGGQLRGSVLPNEGKVQLPVDPRASEVHNEQPALHASVLGKRNDHAACHSKDLAEEQMSLNALKSSQCLCGPVKQDLATQLGSVQAQEADKNSRHDGSVLNQADQGVQQVTCAFCHKSDAQVAGPMIHYKKGIPVSRSKKSDQIFSVHKNCAEWAPGVYFEDDIAKNIPQEVARGHKIKCHVCGLRGAVLGCYVKRCRKSFHFPCAHTLPCRWDDGNFLVFCPEHVASRFPDESAIGSSSKSVNVPESSHKEERARQGLFDKECKLHSKAAIVEPFMPSQPLDVEDYKEEFSNKWAAPKWPASQLLEIEDCKGEPSNMWPASRFVICGSGLNPKANDLLATFISCTGITYEKTWTPSVTHLIAGTDEVGAARRTFKYLVANLEGKWILKVDWLSACMAADRYVNEEPYEVNLDIHGMIGGPRRARGMAIAKVHRVFEGLRFYFLGEYAAAYKADLQALLTAAGGVVLNRMPDASGDMRTCTILVYSKEMYPDTSACHKEELNKSRYLEAKSFAAVIGAKVVGHTWILDSVAAYELQPFE